MGADAQEDLQTMGGASTYLYLTCCCIASIGGIAAIAAVLVRAGRRREGRRGEGPATVRSLPLDPVAPPGEDAAEDGPGDGPD